ncbi:hypothetical protein C8J57DRAFT_1582275 [Mycena rebaudengoi]|nr:hypothetical protein C8J57DRAFT_1582275 [Mycena rebaudengoi]
MPAHSSARTVILPPGLPSPFLPQSSTFSVPFIAHRLASFSRLYLPHNSLRSSCTSPCALPPCPPSSHVTPCPLPPSPSFHRSSHCRIPVPNSPFFLFRRPIRFTSTLPPPQRALSLDLPPWRSYCPSLQPSPLRAILLHPFTCTPLSSRPDSHPYAANSPSSLPPRSLALLPLSYSPHITHTCAARSSSILPARSRHPTHSLLHLHLHSLFLRFRSALFSLSFLFPVYLPFSLLHVPPLTVLQSATAHPKPRSASALPRRGGRGARRGHWARLGRVGLGARDVLNPKPKGVCRLAGRVCRRGGCAHRQFRPSSSFASACAGPASLFGSASASPPLSASGSPPSASATATPTPAPTHTAAPTAQARTAGERAGARGGGVRGGRPQAQTPHTGAMQVLYDGAGRRLHIPAVRIRNSHTGGAQTPYKVAGPGG